MNPFGDNPFGTGGASPPGATPLARPPLDPFSPSPFGDSGTQPSVDRPNADETNVLATLSVIFSFVFAPAGAVLGHVALGQIARRRLRGRDRALVGITLSYSFIVTVVVGLIVWAALPAKTQHVAGSTMAAPAPALAPSTASPSATTPPTTPPAPSTRTGPTPPVTPSTIGGLLLDSGELERALKMAFKPAPRRPATAGGLDALPNGLKNEADASPHDCVGATSITQRSIYQPAPVIAFAASDDWEPLKSHDVMFVTQAVVALPTEADARTWFTTFADQWRRCEGKTVTVLAGKAPDGSNFVDQVTDVRVLDPIVAATIRSDHTTGGYARASARALGVRGNALVEVDVAFYGTATTDPPPGVKDAGIDVARALLDKQG